MQKRQNPPLKRGIAGIKNYLLWFTIEETDTTPVKLLSPMSLGGSFHEHTLESPRRNRPD